MTSPTTPAQALTALHSAPHLEGWPSAILTILAAILATVEVAMPHVIQLAAGAIVLLRLWTELENRGWVKTRRNPKDTPDDPR